MGLAMAGLFLLLGLPAVQSQLNARYITVPYTIGDPLYLYVFTKKAHQVWTQLLSQGGYPTPYDPDNFVPGYRPKARHFHSAEFWNGSMFIWGGIDKDMYFNDIWRYKIPTFSSDRSKWFELVVLWERDIKWLKFNNNRYNHEILKDVYEQVCKDVFDSASHDARGDGWERGMESSATSAVGTYDPMPTETEPKIRPIPGRNPVIKDIFNRGQPAQGWEPWGSEWGMDASYVETGKWVCEEIQMRYEYTLIPETFLTQDFSRPSGRFASGLKLIYTDVDGTYKKGKCNYTSTGFWQGGQQGPPYWSTTVDKSVFNDTGYFIPYEKNWHHMPNTTETDARNIEFHNIYEPRVTGIDRRTHWVVPDGCRPQMIMIGGFDVNSYYLIDIWFFDLWNSTWQHVIPIPPSGRWDPTPYPRKFPSVNVYCPGYVFEVPQKYVVGQKFNELIYVMGGWAEPPIGAFQDVWAYDREQNKFLDLTPVGRMPSARVYDEIQVIGTVGYLIGGVFGAFKIDVMKYNFVNNRFSLLYAAGAKPSARSYFSTTVYRDSVYVFGGRGWVTVDNEDKQDMWEYNSTSNFWYNKEITGITIPRRWGHSMVTFVSTLIVFGGFSSYYGTELGIGDMNEVWRYDLTIGALLADSQFKDNVQGWNAYQNYVEGDYIIPTHCDDYAQIIGDYWGMPCKITYDRASEQYLWIDTMHNDTETPPRDDMGRPTGRTVVPSPFLGANGIGYVAAPHNYVVVGNKMYQGRLRYRYMKIFPMEDDELDRAFTNTKDDVLLVGEYQVLAFDILDELAPRLGSYTLVDVDLDEAKGWYVHGTNGTVVPTKDEFISVLSTLQMILLRVDYYPSIYRKNVSNYDDLGTVLEVEDAYRYTNDSKKGDDHNSTHKVGFDTGFHPYGDRSDRIGVYPEWDNPTYPEKIVPGVSRGSSKGIWKFTYDLFGLGRKQSHGEIIAIKTVELFENTAPLEQDFLNAKVEGRTVCTVHPIYGETCGFKNETETGKPRYIPPHNMDIPTHQSQPPEVGA